MAGKAPKIFVTKGRTKISDEKPLTFAERQIVLGKKPPKESETYFKKHRKTIVDAEAVRKATTKQHIHQWASSVTTSRLTSTGRHPVPNQVMSPANPDFGPDMTIPLPEKNEKRKIETPPLFDTEIRSDPEATTREQIIMSRRGQGLFRMRVEQIEPRCRVTGTSILTHLIASHIKPWRACSDAEKLDGNNGLLLSPHVDHLFDKGYISFTNQGELLVSRQLDRALLDEWMIDTSINVGRFSQKQEVYLEYHRAYVFRK